MQVHVLLQFHLRTEGLVKTTQGRQSLSVRASSGNTTYLYLWDSRGETVSHEEGKGFGGDLSKCFSLEAQCHIPWLQWSLLKCCKTKSRFQVFLLYFPGCSILAQKGRNGNKSSVKDAFRQKGRERLNALAKGSRLLPALFQDVLEEAGDIGTELSVLILLYHLLTSLKNCSA